MNDGFTHTPYWYKGFYMPLPVLGLEIQEAILLQLIVDYFQGYGGSIPSERIQNILKRDHGDLYHSVVVTYYRRRWHRFIEYNSKSLMLFWRTSAHDSVCWRIRLASSKDWEEVDRVEELKKDRWITERLRCILTDSPSKSRIMTEVVSELNCGLYGDSKVHNAELKRFCESRAEFRIIVLDADGSRHVQWSQE